MGTSYKVLLLWLALWLLSAAASAQPASDVGDALASEPAAPTAAEPTKEELAAARALFVEGKELEAEGKWAEALEKFERVAQVKMTPQVRFHIALCHEHLGRLVDAINGFELAAQEAEKMGDKAQEVLENAPPRAEALRARVGHLTFRIEGTVRSSKIFVDDRPLSTALADTKIPIDPGEHVLEVRRDGEVPQSRELYIEEAETLTIDLEIHDPKPTPTPGPGPGEGPSPERPPAEDESVRIPAYVVGGAGAASLIASGVLFGLRQETLSQVSCDNQVARTGCDPDDKGTVALARRYDIASKVMLGVGSAALATGAVLWFVLAPEDAQPQTGATQAWVDVGLGGAVGRLRVRF